MVIKTVSQTYERKVNLGDFNSAHIGITVWADLEPGDDEHESMRALWLIARDAVKEQAGSIHQKLEAKVTEVFAGLPVDVQKNMNGAN